MDSCYPLRLALSPPSRIFRIPAVQKEAASRVAGLLTEIFDSPVQLERVELMSWTNIEAHRVIVLDTAGDVCSLLTVSSGGSP